MEPSQTTPPPPSSPSPKLPERKPWPMSWVIYAILAFVVVQTLVNLEFRKPEKAHEPAAEMAEREKRHHFVSASMNGWTRLAPTITPDAGASGDMDSPARASAHVEQRATQERLDREIPLELAGLIPEEPKLHDAPDKVVAPATLATGDALAVALTFAPEKDSRAFGEMLGYTKENHLYLFVQDERRLEPDTRPVSNSTRMKLTVPAGAFAAGEWRVTLFATGTAFEWTFVVK